MEADAPEEEVVVAVVSETEMLPPVARCWRMEEEGCGEDDPPYDVLEEGWNAVGLTVELGWDDREGRDGRCGGGGGGGGGSGDRANGSRSNEGR